MKIKSISLDFPNCDNGEVIYYEVGVLPFGHKKPIMEIRRSQRNGEMALIDFYEIYNEDGIIAEMHQYGHIQYELKESTDGK